MPKKKKEDTYTKRTITGALNGRVINYLKEGEHFFPDRTYHLSKKFEIKPLRGKYIQVVRRVRKKRTITPTNKYVVRIISSELTKGWKYGDTLKVHKGDIKTSCPKGFK